jgi:hypothetical protein
MVVPEIRWQTVTIGFFFDFRAGENKIPNFEHGASVALDSIPPSVMERPLPTNLSNLLCQQGNKTEVTPSFPKMLGATVEADFYRLNSRTSSERVQKSHEKSRKSLTIGQTTLHVRSYRPCF